MSNNRMYPGMPSERCSASRLPCTIAISHPCTCCHLLNGMLRGRGAEFRFMVVTMRSVCAMQAALSLAAAPPPRQSPSA